jgi:pSer/pThr/pTyr-binding forkhead associated (FHA) protein
MTVKIIILKEDKPIDQILVDQDKVVIGRRAECDIPIKDPAVSGNHAEIEFVGNGYILRDLGSTNGVHIKGRQIKEHALKNEDLITIGEHQLRVLITKSPPTKKRVARPPAPNVEREVTEVRNKPVTPQVVGQAGARIDGHLKFIKGGEPGALVELNEALTTIGTPGIQVAAISKRPQGHVIIHVDGGKDRNKTPLVNSEAIGFKSRKLEAGDLIEVADMQLEYCID